MRRKKRLNASVDFAEFTQFEPVIEKYLPNTGEGDNLASQAVTAVNKLIYKWYNDGDVFDNVMSGLSGWANDLSSYANWLYKHTNKEISDILMDIRDCNTEDDYEDLLQSLAFAALNEDYLQELSSQPTAGSIYDEDGPFRFEDVEAEEEEYWEEDGDEWEEDEGDWEEVDDFDSSRRSARPRNSQRTNSGKRSSTRRRSVRTNSDRFDMFQNKYDYAKGWMNELQKYIASAVEALDAGDYRDASFKLRGSRRIIDSLEPNIRELEEMSS